jgi:2-oxo-4-hydroxy-4-carboxy-5-ureidoimidazoline decarboxylase
MTLSELNQMSIDEAQAALTRCCGSTRWAAAMVAHRPFAGIIDLHAQTDAAWATMERADVLEAFSQHPQIGVDVDNLRQKFANTATWSASEQSGIDAVDEVTLQSLAEGNRQYLAKFGYIFIVCASGKSANEMLSQLRWRLSNDPQMELPIAAAEQAKITHLRLNKLVDVG